MLKSYRHPGYVVRECERIAGKHAERWMIKDPDESWSECQYAWCQHGNVEVVQGWEIVDALIEANGEDVYGVVNQLVVNQLIESVLRNR